MGKKLSDFDRVALLPIYAKKTMRSRGGLAVSRGPKKSHLLTMEFALTTWEYVKKLAEATSLLVGFRISPEQLTGLLVEIILKTTSKKELLKMQKPG